MTQTNVISMHAKPGDRHHSPDNKRFLLEAFFANAGREGWLFNHLTAHDCEVLAAALRDKSVDPDVDASERLDALEWSQKFSFHSEALLQTAL